jgi:MFS family permease
MPKNFSVNRIIRTIIISDFFLFFAVGLLGPIFAVFLMEHIENRIEIVGYAVSCYWLTRVIMVMPLSRLMDKIKGELDEFFFMALGTFMIGAVPLFYLLASEPWHVYLLQVLNGLAYALAVPAWRIVFTNNVDRHIVGYEWSLEDVAVGIATALSASLGAIIADKFGFDVLFFIIFAFGTISALILLTLNIGKRSFLRELLHNGPDKAPLKIDSFK